MDQQGNISSSLIATTCPHAKVGGVADVGPDGISIGVVEREDSEYASDVDESDGSHDDDEEEKYEKGDDLSPDALTSGRGGTAAAPEPTSSTSCKSQSGSNPGGKIFSSVDPETRRMINYVLNYSFSSHLNKNAQWLGIIFNSLGHIIDFIANRPREKITMRNILKFISPLVGQQLFTINRKKEEILSVEAVIVLAFMKSPHSENLQLELDEFLDKYPNFKQSDVASDEREKLLEFCNCVRVIQQLIPPKNNKEHILDLVSRLTEGFAIKRVTGTGMTVETRNRYDIIHIEGGLIPRQKVDRAERAAERRAERALLGLEEDDSSRRKRGRPFRDDTPSESSPPLNNSPDEELLFFLQAGQFRSSSETVPARPATDTSRFTATTLVTNINGWAVGTLNPGITQTSISNPLLNPLLDTMTSLNPKY